MFLRPWTEVLSGYLRPLWLIGTLAALVLLAYTNLSFYAKLRRTRRPIGSTEAGLPAYETDAIASPCLFGLFRPAIYVRAEDAGRLRHVRRMRTATSGTSTTSGRCSGLSASPSTGGTRWSGWPRRSPARTAS